ncbi:MAG: competence/damage-inducible protein A [Bdellovibrionota bacterium]
MLEGRILNTNAQWLSRKLYSLGFKVTAIAVCDDVISEINESSKKLLDSADILISTGGLGPTSDDITREAYEKFLQVPLVTNQLALNEIKAYFDLRKREMNDLNVRQALMPKAAIMLSNKVGTAPGFAYWIKLASEKKLLIVLPGPPRELYEMYQSFVIPLLESAEFTRIQVCEKILRIFGVGESSLQSLITPLKLPSSVEIAYRYHFPEVQILLKSLNHAETEAAYQALKNHIPSDVVFSESAEISLAETVHNLLIDKRQSLSLAESCTGGLISKLLTDISGSSEYLLGAGVTYANSAKQKLLNVTAETLATKGAVSFEAARQMADGARKFFGSELAISVTGIAGPSGGSADKPVGTFYLGFASSSESQAYQGFFSGTRDTIRKFAAFAALDLLRRKLLNLPPHGILRSE